MVKKSVYLPEELITEILLRLPVKSVLRCRCVCKSWLSLISHPNFATSHFQLAASPTHKLVIVKVRQTLNFYDREAALLIDFNASLNDDSAYHSLSLDFLPHQSYPGIGGSCRGFLLLSGLKCFYVWNPSTGVNKQIPMSPITLADNEYYILRFLYGLAYEPSNDDYLVVLGTYECDLNYDGYYPVSSSIDLEVFSLRANKWKQVAVGSHLPYMVTYKSSDDPRVGSFLNGSIHWLVHNHETYKDVIIAFDLKEMTMSEIALPDDFDYRYSYYDFLVFRGLIAAWIVDFETVKIWVMQEYAVNSSWTQTLVFSMHHDIQFSLISFTNCGDLVGIDEHDSELKKFNDKGQLREHHFYHHCRFLSIKSQITEYTESLLSLPSVTDQA